jgi:glycosyltransferase involved in cell wall biosynthesis
MVRALDKTKFHPVVLFLCADQKLIELYRSYGIETVGPLGLTDFSHTVMQWYRWHQLKEFAKVLWSSAKTWWSIADEWYDRIQPDIVHVNTSSLTIWAQRAYRRKIPVIFHIREPLTPGHFGIRKWLVKNAVARYATAIVPISNNESLPWQKLAKTQVIYNAVDPQWFDASLTLKKNSCPTILFVGGCAPEKGTLLILQAYEQLLVQVPHARLQVAGYFQPTSYPWWHPRRFSFEQKYSDEVQKLIARLPKYNVALQSPGVEILGSRKDIPQLMAASDVVVFPASLGHFARPVIEAGFMKKPVIASALPPLNELVQDGVTGFLVPPNDSAQWATQLTRLLTDVALNKQMGEQAYDFCQKKFLLADHIQKIESIYQNVR